MEHYKSWRKISGRNNDYDIYMFTDWNITNLREKYQVEIMIMMYTCSLNGTLQIH
jgi:hypothetical protein